VRKSIQHRQVQWDHPRVNNDSWGPATQADVWWLARASTIWPRPDQLHAVFPDLTWVEVLHPAYRELATGERVEVSWDAVGAVTGRAPHPGTRFDTLVGLPINGFLNGLDEPNGVWTHPPDQGTLPQSLARRLKELLSRHTSSTFALTGVWSGWAFAAPLRHDTVPTGVAFGRDHLLFRAPLDKVDTSVDEAGYQCANLWVPADRRWVLVTDIDSWSTLVGAAEAVIRELSALDDVEVRPLP
jgi:hypothetical protein